MAKITSYHDTSVTASLAENGIGSWVYAEAYPRRNVDYRFFNHYHPYSEELVETLTRDGLPAMLDVNYQASLVEGLVPSRYELGKWVEKPFPGHEIDVSDGGAYAIYNWELGFHVPVSIAVHLSKNQRFAEAQHWFHFIFDPTSTDKSVPPPQRFWKFLRFRQETTPEFIHTLLLELAKGTDSELKKRIEQAIVAWRDRPFRPHVIARGRYLAYQMNVVMKYLDNLIAWGDSLFRQDTLETLNEATQIYVLAASILGPKPQKTPPRGTAAPRSYAQLREAGIDAFGNALIEMENEFPFNTYAGGGTSGTGATGTEAVLGIGRSLYFCIPQNDKLLEYWARVEDRLFKIRHCMNIEGTVRQLALFDPPIDPGVLVRAVAAGLDIASIVNNISQPVSNVRGPLLLQKAMEICNEVKSLGSLLLSAIEKGDAEHIALLRQQHQSKILDLGRDVRFLQWKEAEAATDALLESRGTVFERYKHYKRILGVTDTSDLETVELARTDLTEENFDGVFADWVGRYAQPLAREAYRKETSVGGLMEFAGEQAVAIFGGELGETLPLNKNEHAELNIFLPTSDTFNTIATALSLAAPLLALIPQFNAHGTPLGVGGAVGFGGVELSKGAKYGAEGAKMIANAFASSAERAARLATYYRRAEDYVLQANVATSELEQYGRQVISALLREQILKREYENHLEQVENAKAEEEFLREKFSNEELYTWMQGQLSETYYECYKLAFDVAKLAEQTLRHELMRPQFDELNFIKFGYWDSGHRGLLAGETLALDLKRLEMAYHEHNRRELELTKHVSLARIDPIALLELKATGSCEVTIPEWLFDLSGPGQYMRRIKTVALSIPCVTGPYTGVHCKLSLLRSSVRTSSLLGDQYERNEDSEDGRFRDFAGAIQSIVTSSGQNDSGVFELSLRDERHLPFEGAGAISTWRLNLPSDVPEFDFETISDVVFHLRFTAREAGHLEAPASAYVKENVLQKPQGMLQLFTLDHDFGNAWHRFEIAEDDASRRLDLEVRTDRFPYWVEPLGMDDALSATFAVIDWKKNRLTLAPANVDFAGTAEEGWTLRIDETSPVFSFLKRHMGATVYMPVSFAVAS